MLNHHCYVLYFSRNVQRFYTQSHRIPHLSQQVNWDHCTQLVSSLIHAHQGLSGISILVEESLVTIGSVQLKTQFH